MPNGIMPFPNCSLPTADEEFYFELMTINEIFNGKVSDFCFHRSFLVNHSAFASFISVIIYHF